ncbi:MAG: NUDIX domain-containing protein [Myxococcota bacterium]
MSEPTSPPTAAPAQPRAAATVLIVRTAPTGLEVFMVQRHRRSGFLPNAWVFPGGRVDEGDRIHGNPRVAGRIALAGLSDSGASAYGVAAVRETFEEAGIWLGTGAPTDADRDALNRGDSTLAKVLEERDATLHLERLRPWSWWITPLAEPKRFDTRFLIAVVDVRSGRHDDGETVDSRWVSPRVVLTDDQRSFPLAPPTWWTLRELAAYASAEAAFEAAITPLVPILPVMQLEQDSVRLLLPGHPDHGAPAIDGLPDRLTYEQGWVGWKGDERLPSVPDIT